LPGLGIAGLIGMLHLASKIRGATVRATDGDIGSVEDFYFEQFRWTVRYIVVNTGKWLSDRRVLLSPMSVRGEWGMSGIPVELTRDQVKSSPELDLSGPLSRASETEVLGYYGYPAYWGADGLWGTFGDPGALVLAPPERPAPVSSKSTVDPEELDLQSTQTITGYHIQAADGEIGHVDDFLIGEQSWRIRYLRVDTSNWIGGKSVIVLADELEWVDRKAGKLHIGLTREAVKQGPSFESLEPALSVRETGPPFVIL
jgi:hypothetical protein